MGSVVERHAGFTLPRQRAFFFRCGVRTRLARRLAFHCRPQNAVHACLITSAAILQPFQYVRVMANGELLLDRGPCFRCLGKELIAKGRNVRIVDIRFLDAVNPSQVALDRFLAHVDLHSSWS